MKRSICQNLGLVLTVVRKVESMDMYVMALVKSFCNKYSYIRSTAYPLAIDDKSNQKSLSLVMDLLLLFNINAYLLPRII